MTTTTMSNQQCAVQPCGKPARLRVQYTDSETGQEHDHLVCGGCAQDIYEDCGANGMNFKTRPMETSEPG